MTNKKLNIALAVIVSSAAGTAGAQYIRPAYAYPAPIAGGTQIGDTPLFFTPYVGLGVGHDDNLFLSRNNRKSTDLYVVSPGFKVDAKSEAMVFQGSYQAQIGRYTSSADDNYVDHVARAQLDTAFSGRSFLRVGLDYFRSHDPRGSTDRPLSGRPDRYQLWNPSATYAFGAPGAQGRVELYASDLHKKYVSNRAVTATGDRTQPEFGGAFYWRVASKTYAMAEVRNTEIHYDLPNSNTGEERRYYAGVSWEATAKTIGTLKVGQARRQFDDGTPSKNFSSWEGLVNWAPLTYSTFDFYTSRQTNEATGLGARFIISSVAGVNWTHAWTSFLNTGAGLRYQRDEYQGFDRTDNLKSANFKLGYRFRPWLTIGGEYTYTKRDSNQPAFEYDKNLYMLTATASM